MNGAAIFAYHNFVERPDTPAPASQAYVLSQAQFDAHLAALAEPGLRPSRLADVLATPSPGQFVLSFDDGYMTDYTVAFARLAERGWPGCFFIVASQVGASRALGWRELREMAAAGMEIGSHSLTHPFVNTLDRAGIEREFGESKRILESRLGLPVRTASLPRGWEPPDLRPVLQDLGYRVFCNSRVAWWYPGADALAMPRVAIRRGLVPEEFASIVNG